MLKSLGLDMPAKAKEQNGQDAMGEFNSPKNYLEVCPKAIWPLPFLKLDSLTRATKLDRFPRYKF